MESKLDRIKAILEEPEPSREEKSKWEDITKWVEVKVCCIDNSALIDLYDGELPIGLFDLKGFTCITDEYKVETNFVSCSLHDNGGKVTWFKVYKRK